MAMYTVTVVATLAAAHVEADSEAEAEQLVEQDFSSRFHPDVTIESCTATAVEE